MSPKLNKNDIDTVKLLRYLMGDARISREEEEKIRVRLRADPDWMQLRHGQENPDRAAIDWETEAEVRKLKAQIGAESTAERTRGPEARTLSSRRARRSSSSGRSRLAEHPLLRVAAVLLFVAFSTLLVVQLQKGPQPDASAPTGKVFVTKKGERSILQLTDGTRVRLNVDSRLRLAADFSSGVREVWLQGEAYFHVAEDSMHPFIVHADPATVHVLGTEFDVSAYSDDPAVRVVVAKGKVSLRSEQTSFPEEVALMERQMGQLSRTGEQMVHGEVDLNRHLAWMDGQLMFEDAPFDEVTRKLERWYDIEVEQAESTAVSGHLNAKFTEHQSMSEVLNIIATAFGLSYEREGKTVTFFPVK